MIKSVTCLTLCLPWLQKIIFWTQSLCLSDSLVSRLISPPIQEWNTIPLLLHLCDFIYMQRVCYITAVSHNVLEGCNKTVSTYQQKGDSDSSISWRNLQEIYKNPMDLPSGNKFCCSGGAVDGRNWANRTQTNDKPGTGGMDWLTVFQFHSVWPSRHRLATHTHITIINVGALLGGGRGTLEQLTLPPAALSNLVFNLYLISFQPLCIISFVLQWVECSCLTPMGKLYSGVKGKTLSLH